MEERHGASGDVESWSRREYSTRAVPARRVLVVSIPPANARIATVLAECDLEFAATAATAVAEARARAFHCALVSVITPDAFDVAKALHEAAPELPVICVRVVDERHRLTRATLEGLRLAAGAVGARGFVDFFDFPDDERGLAAVRDAIDTLC